MEWLINALVNAIKKYNKFSDNTFEECRKNFRRLLSNTLYLAINERSFPIAPACHMIALFEDSLAKLPRKKITISRIYNNLVGSMIVALKYESDLNYYLEDFITPVSIVYNQTISIVQLAVIEFDFLRDSSWDLSTSAAKIMPAVLPLINANDMMPFWRELNANDYFDNEEYVAFARPIIAEIYKDQLVADLLEERIFIAQPYYASKLILKRVKDFCLQATCNEDIDIICEVLSSSDFDILRSLKNKHYSVFNNVSHPTLWDKIALTLSAQKTTQERKMAAHSLQP
jgi:hypothetical protein